MARIKLSPLITDIRGKIGNAVFQQSCNGLIVRNNPVRRRSITEFQNISRTNVSIVQAAWAALSSSQLSIWNSYVSLNNSTMKHNKSLFLSPYQLFLKYNLIRLAAGLSVLSSISFEYAIEPNSILEIISNGGTLTVEPYSSVNPSVSWFLLKISKVTSSDSAINTIPLKVIPISTSSSPPYDITSQYVSRFLSIPAYEDYVVTSLLSFSVIAPAIAPEIKQINFVDN